MKKLVIVSVLVFLLALSLASAVYAGGGDVRSADGPRVSWDATPTRAAQVYPCLDGDCQPADDPDHAHVWCGVDGDFTDCPQRDGHPTE